MSAPVDVLAVVVAYRRAWTDVACAGTLMRLLAGAGRTPAALRLGMVLIYDNSPEPVARPSARIEAVEYRHDPANSGTRGAYAYALERAKRQGSDWILLLDQDTALPEDYLECAAAALGRVEAGPVAALLPRVRAGGRPLSPAVLTRSGSVRPLVPAAMAPEAGSGAVNVTGIASGSMLRVCALAAALPGENLWLDYVDHWIFRQLARRGLRVVVFEAVLEHSLSIHDMRSVTRARLYSILDGERTFTASLGRLARLALPVRWAGRLLRLACSHPRRAGDMLSWLLGKRVA